MKQFEIPWPRKSHLMRLKWLNRMPQRPARLLPLPKFCRLNRQN
ncbi:Uncharacterised protein [Vibrio cholerae]|nr:Uncharacterised protein [Vibrio cholerae]